MTMRGLLFTAIVVAGCTKADAEQDRPAAPAEPVAQAPGVAGPPPPAPVPTPLPPPPVPVAPTPPARPAPRDVRVELTAVTLADDCGGTAPYVAPAIKAKAKSAKAESAKADSAKADSAYTERRCEQTSMQLSITTVDSARLTVKSVELFDDAGTSLGKLTASQPTRWSVDKSMYERWNEKLPANTTVNVSYVLQQPDWARIGNRWNRRFTVKTVLTIGGADRKAQKAVTLSAPAALAPPVKT